MALAGVLRPLRHSLYLTLVKAHARLQPGSDHLAYTGPGSSRALCDHIAAAGVGRLLVVTDAALRQLGVVAQAVETLESSGVTPVYYDGVQPDPTFAQVAEGTEIYRANRCDAVLAVGGGSSIDAAKVIAAAAVSDQDPRNWIGPFRMRHIVPPIFAIPTTAGTGSEATMGAVISDSDSHEKSIIIAPQLLPAAAALDPFLARELPPPITAATGMDALTHGIETYIGTWDRGRRLDYARIAVDRAFRYLRRACENGADSEARQGLALGAYYGGMAVNLVNIGNVHAIAHQLGARYGIPHGQANALVLPEVLEFCREQARPRLAELAVLIGAGEPGESEDHLAGAFIRSVRELREAVGIATRSELIQPRDFDDLARAAVIEGMGYPVPRLLDEAAVKQVLGQVAA